MFFLGLTGCAPKDWRTTSREPAGIAPNPATTREAVLQVYGASAWGWRGLPVLHIEKDLPDRYWFGERPRLLKEFRGDGVDKLIAAIGKKRVEKITSAWAEQKAIREIMVFLRSHGVGKA